MSEPYIPHLRQNSIHLLLILFPKRQRVYTSPPLRDVFKKIEVCSADRICFLLNHSCNQVLFFCWHYVSPPAKLIPTLWSLFCYGFTTKVNLCSQEKKRNRSRKKHTNPRERLCRSAAIINLCLTAPPMFKSHCLLQSLLWFPCAWHYPNQDKCKILLSLFKSPNQHPVLHYHKTNIQYLWL